MVAFVLINILNGNTTKAAIFLDGNNPLINQERPDNYQEKLQEKQDDKTEGTVRSGLTVCAKQSLTTCLVAENGIGNAKGI